MGKVGEEKRGSGQGAGRKKGGVKGREGGRAGGREGGRGREERQQRRKAPHLGLRRDAHEIIMQVHNGRDLRGEVEKEGREGGRGGTMSAML
jgi:hypothetical protein